MTTLATMTSLSHCVRLGKFHLAALRRLAAEQPILSHAEIVRRFKKEAGRTIGKRSVARHVPKIRKELGVSRKPDPRPEPAVSPDFRERVLDACNALIARNLYPSVLRIQTELQSSHRSDVILDARHALLESGELTFPAKFGGWRGQRTGRERTHAGLEGRTIAERAEITQNALAIRQAALAAATKPEGVTLRGRLLLDVLASRELDALSPAAACDVVRRRTRKALPELWRGVNYA